MSTPDSSTTDVVFRLSPMWLDSYNLATERIKSKFKKTPQEAHAALNTLIAQFKEAKSSKVPTKFGSRDAPFAVGTPLYQALKSENLMHAHLGHDLNIIYTISGKNPRVIKLYILGTHDDLGIGTPSNKKTQQKVAKRIATQSVRFE